MKKLSILILCLILCNCATKTPDWILENDKMIEQNRLQQLAQNEKQNKGLKKINQ